MRPAPTPGPPVTDSVIRTFLDLSTGHLREETCRRLGDYEGVIAHNLRYGWLLFVPDTADGRDTSDWPDELTTIVRLAQSCGCAYVLLDADGPHVAELPVFDW